jgi:DNA-binding MarR family transcriptional regulator
MTVEDAARQLAEEVVLGEGVHRLSTLNPAKVRTLAAIHHLGRPCTVADLVVALGWTQQYVYRNINELTVQGILIQTARPNGKDSGRPIACYHCSCTSIEEGSRK